MGKIMHMTRNTILLLSVLVVAACSGTGPGRFGLGGGGGNIGGQSINSGDVSDPTSPAYFEQTVGDRVLFEVDQSTLTDEARLTLASQANWLMANVEFNAIVEGHADEQGTREYNIALSDRRANAVKEYLVSRGIAANRIETVPYGKERPIALCSNESCYSQNRRAVTVLTANSLG
jgi:peptidoglycan-associated lipoprotein